MSFASASQVYRRTTAVNLARVEQAANCDVVILATHWPKAPEALKGIDWHGRILIDATNAHLYPKPISALRESQIAGRVEVDGAHIQRVDRRDGGGRTACQIDQ
jgi:predicted dinucleotide-binding enzyme